MKKLCKKIVIITLMTTMSNSISAASLYQPVSSWWPYCTHTNAVALVNASGTGLLALATYAFHKARSYDSAFLTAFGTFICSSILCEHLKKDCFNWH